MKHATGKTRLLAVTVAAFCLSGLATQASASDRRVPTERFTEYARVIDAIPVYRQVRLREPRNECWVEERREIVGYERTTRHDRHRTVQRHAGHSSGNVIVGGLIGGVIGNQLGRGHSSNSRTGATVAGAIIGGAIANESTTRDARHRRHRPATRVESRPVYETRQVEQCKRVVEPSNRRELQHYNVTYEYKGRRFTTQLPRDPGRRIELQVSVSPARR